MAVRSIVSLLVTFTVVSLVSVNTPPKSPLPSELDSAKTSCVGSSETCDAGQTCMEECERQGEDESDCEDTCLLQARQQKSSAFKTARLSRRSH